MLMEAVLPRMIAKIDEWNQLYISSARKSKLYERLKCETLLLNCLLDSITSKLDIISFGHLHPSGALAQYERRVGRDGMAGDGGVDTKRMGLDHQLMDAAYWIIRIGVLLQERRLDHALARENTYVMRASTFKDSVSSYLVERTALPTPTGRAAGRVSAAFTAAPPSS